MRSKKAIVTVLLVLGLALCNVATLLVDAKATAAVRVNNTKTFMAGSWITADGAVIGCKCPRESGPCTCQIEPTKP